MLIVSLIAATVQEPGIMAGERVQIQLQEGQTYNTSISVGSGQTCRFYVESDEAVAEFCYDANNCPEENRITGSGSVVLQPDTHDTTITVQIRSAAAARVYFTGQCAVELYPLIPQVATANQLFAFFLAVPQAPLVIQTDIDCTVTFNYSQFDGQHYNMHTLNSLSVTANSSAQLLIPTAPGWVYLSLNADGNVWLSQEEPVGIIIAPDSEYDIPVYKFAETVMYRVYVAEDPADALISAFTKTPLADGGVYIVGQDLLPHHGIAQVSAAAAAQPVPLLFHFEKNYFLVTKDLGLYSSQDSVLHVLTRNGAKASAGFPAAIPYDFASEERQLFVVDTLTLDPTVVSGYTSIGYIFAFVSNNSIRSTIHAAVQAYGVTRFGAGFGYESNTAQAFISQYSSAFERGGMYYVEAESRGGDTGSFRAEASYEATKGQPLRVHNVDRHLNFFVRTAEFVDKQYTACFVVDAASHPGLAAGDFTLVASNTHYIPASEVLIHDFEYSTYAVINGMHHYCVSHRGLPNKTVAFLSLVREDHGEPAVEGTLAVYEWYGYLTKVYPYQLTAFTFTQQNQLALEPPFYQDKKYKYIKQEFYFYVEITRKPTNSTVTLGVQGTSINTTIGQEGIYYREIELDTTRHYVLNVACDQSGEVEGRVYIGPLYSGQKLGRIPVGSQANVSVLKLARGIVHSPAAMFMKPADLKLEAFLCPSHPQLEYTSDRADCTKYVFGAAQDYTVYLPYDDHKTGGTQLTDAAYYLTVFPTNDTGGPQNLQFELIEVRNMITNIKNPVHLAPDPVGSRFSGANQTWQVFDILLFNEQGGTTQLAVELDQPALNASLCGKPYGYLSLYMRRSQYCSTNINNGSRIEATVNFNGDKYKRVFLHVLGNQTTKMLSSIKVTAYQVINASADTTIRYTTNAEDIGRELVNERCYQISTKANSVEFISHVDTEDMQTAWENGQTGHFHLLVSQDPDFTTYERDDSTFVQIISQQFDESADRTFYVRVVPQHLITSTIPMVFGVAENNGVSQSDELNLMVQTTVSQPRGTYSYRHMRMLGDPVYINYQVCSCPANSTLEVYATNLQPRPNHEMPNGVDSLRFNFNPVNGTQFFQRIPPRGIPYPQNTNVFLSAVNNDADIEYVQTFILGITTPLFPRDQRTHFVRNGSKMMASFAGALVQSDGHYGVIHYIKLENETNHRKLTTSYQIFAYSNRSAEAGHVRSNYCGLRKFAQNVTDWQELSYNSTLHMEFEYNGTDDSTMFAIVVRNDVTGETNVYSPTGWTSLQTTVNTAALVGGIIGGLLAVAVIVVLAVALALLIKRGKRAQEIQQRPDGAVSMI